MGHARLLASITEDMTIGGKGDLSTSQKTLRWICPFTDTCHLSPHLRCSTKALEVAGLLVDGASLASLCPRDGKIVTDASNRPVGLLYDAAQDLILRAIPPLTQEVGEGRAFEDSLGPLYLYHQYNIRSPIRTSNPRSDWVYCCQVRVAALKLALDRMMSLGITGYLEALVKNDRYGTFSQPIIKTSNHALSYLVFYHRQLAVYQQLYADKDMASRLPWGRLAMQCRSLQDVQALKVRLQTP